MHCLYALTKYYVCNSALQHSSTVNFTISYTWQNTLNTALQCVHKSLALHSVVLYGIHPHPSVLWTAVHCVARWVGGRGGEGTLPVSAYKWLMHQYSLPYWAVQQSPKWLIAREMVEISPAPALSCVCQFACLNSAHFGIFDPVYHLTSGFNRFGILDPIYPLAG